MPRYYRDKLWPDKERRMRIIEKNYDEHIIKKVDQYKKDLHNYENKIQHALSIEEDIKRRHKLLTKETL